MRRDCISVHRHTCVRWGLAVSKGPWRRSCLLCRRGLDTVICSREMVFRSNQSGAGGRGGLSGSLRAVLGWPCGQPTSGSLQVGLALVTWPARSLSPWVVGIVPSVLLWSGKHGVSKCQGGGQGGRRCCGKGCNPGPPRLRPA